MSPKRKAAFLFKVGTLGKTASETCHDVVKIPSKRQQFRQIIVWMAVVGILPVFVAELFVKWGGLRHD